MPGEEVGARAGAGRGLGPGGVRPHVRPALLLGHGHPGEQALLGLRRAEARVVAAGLEQRLEPPGQRRRVPQGRDDRVRHGDRAAMAGLGLRPDVELGGAGRVGAGPAIGPGGRVQAVADGGAHQRMPGGVELHLVDPVAPPVVAARHRRMLVGEPGLLAGGGGAGQAA